MTLKKQEAINWLTYLKQESQESYETALDLFEDRHNHFALFFCHLALEKIIKACFLFQKNKFAPPVHDLIFLVKKAGIALQKETITLLAEINTFNIRARYEDYKREFYKKATAEYTKKWLDTTHDLLEFFREKKL